MRVRLRAVWDGIRGSLFWFPAVMLLLGVGLAFAVELVQQGLGDVKSVAILEVHPQRGSTILEVISVSTITVVGLVSSVMVVAVQLASTQFSPRVLRRFLRDPVDQVAIGTVSATFAYAVISLARLPVEGASSARSLQVTVAILLAGASLIAILVFIDHTARAMRAGDVIRRVTEETRGLIAQVYPHVRTAGDGPTPGDDATVPTGEGYVVRAPGDGWVQQLDAPLLLGALPPGGTARVEVPVGKFAIEGRPLVTVWPVPDDPDHLVEEVYESYEFGRQREMVEDVAFGIRQLVDIALRALSPAINDPGTAYEVVYNLGAVLADLLVRDLTPAVLHDDGRRVLQPRSRDHADYVELAFEQIRLVAAAHPAVSIAAINVLRRLVDVVREAGRPELVDVLRAEGHRIVASVRRESHIPYDEQRVEEAAAALGALPQEPVARDRSAGRPADLHR